MPHCESDSETIGKTDAPYYRTRYRMGTFHDVWNATLYRSVCYAVFISIFDRGIFNAQPIRSAVQSSVNPMSGGKADEAPTY